MSWCCPQKEWLYSSISSINLDSSTSCFMTEKENNSLKFYPDFLPEVCPLLHVSTFSCFLNKYHWLVYSSFFFFFVKLYFAEVGNHLPSRGRRTTDWLAVFFILVRNKSRRRSQTWHQCLVPLSCGYSYRRVSARVRTQTHPSLTQVGKADWRSQRVKCCCRSALLLKSNGNCSGGGARPKESIRIHQDMFSWSLVWQKQTMDMSFFLNFMNWKQVCNPLSRLPFWVCSSQKGF